MTVPKWLIPVISVIAALAVGVAATLIGMRFTPTETVTTTPETQIVPVLEPIATGDEVPPTESDGGDGAASDDTPLLVSEAVAEREVTVPAEGSSEATDPTFLNFLGLIGSWPDALFGLLNFDGDGDRADGDDPCSPPVGDPPAGCPDGLRSAIFSDTILRDFSAGGQAFPPTYEEYLANGNPFGGTLWCDGLTEEAGTVPFGILSTAPGHFVVRYWPTDDATDVTTVHVVSTTENIDAWQAQVDLGDDGFPINQECLTLGDVLPGTAYTGTVEGTDILARVAPAHTFRFHSDGAPVHPGLQVTPIGDNLIFASALYSRDEAVTISFGLVEADAEPTCDQASAASSPLTDTTVTVSAEDVAAANAIPSYNQKRIRTFVVPEGATAIVCARWYPGETAPAWESSQRNYESAAIVQAPDRLSPEVNLESVSRYGDALESIDFRVSSAEGIDCYRYTWTSSENVVPARLCYVGDFETGGTAADEGRLSTRGFSGDLVVEATAHLTSGETSTTSYLIPSPDGGCRGTCDVPDRQWYRIALTEVRQGTGLCGSFFGSDCEAPSVGVSAGTAMFYVDWSQGRSNGRETWNITPTSDRSVDYVAPDYAQIDSEPWVYTEPTLLRPYSDVTKAVIVDRPVSYRLTLSNPYTEGAELGVGSPNCQTGAPLETSGHSTALGGVNSIRLFLQGLCLGAEYYAQLELTDDDGRVTIWSVTRSAETWWRPDAFMRAPGLTADVRYDFRAQSYTRSYLRTVEIVINGYSIHPVDTRSGRCLEDGITESHATAADIPVYNVNTVTVRVLIGPSRRWGDGGDFYDPDCLADSTDATVSETTFTVPYTDFMAPLGVDLRSSDPYGSSVQLHSRLSEE